MKTSYKFLITSNMCDPNDNLKPESILDIFQSGGKRSAEYLGLGHKELLTKGYAYVVLRIKYEQFKPLKSNDYVTLTTWPNPNEKVELKRQFQIENELGEVCIKGSSIWVVIDINKRMIQRAEGFKFKVEVNTNEVFYPDLKKIIIPELEQHEVLTYKVNQDDIDNVSHLNNAKYLKLLYLADPSIVSELQIDFIKECKLDDEIVLNKVSDNEYKYLIGYVMDKVHFLIKYR